MMLSIHGKYAMEMDGVGLELVYGQQSGNAGQIAGTNYNDLDETSYSAKITYGNFAAITETMSLVIQATLKEL